MKHSQWIEERLHDLDCPHIGQANRDFDAMRGHYLFSGLDADEYNSLIRSVRRLQLDKGEVLFHRGDHARHFYFVDTGHVELNVVAPTGQKKVVEVLGPGRTFAEAVAFMRESRYPVTCEAVEDCVLYEVSNQAYLDMLASNSGACMRLLSDVCRHLHSRVREIEQLTIQNARSRLASYLIDHIVEVNKDEDEAIIRLELPRHVIASRLSITPETLSRLLRQMVDERQITIEDRVIFVHSLSRLRPYD